MSAVLLMGCGPGKVTISELPDLAGEEALLLSVSDAAAVSTARHFQAVAQAGATLWLLQEGQGAQPMTDDNLALVGAVRDAQGQLLVATDEDIRVWSANRLTGIDVGEGFAGTILSIQTAGEDVWVLTDAGLYLLRDDWMRMVQVDAGSAVVEVVGNGRWNGVPVVWLLTERAIVGLEQETLAVVERRRVAAAASAVTVDGQGVLWLVNRGDVLRGEPDGGWSSQNFSAPVTHIVSNPQDVGVWLETEAGVVYHDGGYAFAGDFSLEGSSVDQLGRLLRPTEDGVVRLGAERTVAVVGLEDGQVVSSSLDVFISPSMVDGINGIDASIDGVAVESDLDAQTVFVDADAWFGGDLHELEVRVSWADGAVSDAKPVTFSVPVLDDVTWSEHINPLSQASCSICHDGSSETILETSADWESNIDGILSMVSSGSMPLGDAALSDAQIGLIRAWRDGGFQ